MTDMTTNPYRARIGLQLYTLRERAHDNLEGVLDDIRAIGYLGVAPSEFYGHSPTWFRQNAAERGLTIPSSHCQLPAGEEAQRILAEQAELGSPVVYISLDQTHFVSEQAVADAARRMNVAASAAAEFNIELGYHNHWWEFSSTLDGRPAYDVFMDRLDPTILTEIDIYWAQVGGADPTELVRRLGQRVRHLHVKDGPVDRSSAMTAVGQGHVDVAEVLRANPAVQWHLVELDHCATDMTEAVRESYAYLVRRGLSEGRA